MTLKIKIEILSGQLQGTVKEFDKPLISAGSLLSDDISFKGYSNILPGHLTIKLENNKVLLVNNCMASIYINGEEKREAELNPGDEITFGKEGTGFKIIEIGDSEESIVKEETVQELPDSEEKTVETIPALITEDTQPIYESCFWVDTPQEDTTFETESTEQTFESSYDLISEDILDDPGLISKTETLLPATAEPKQEEITIYEPETPLIETSQPDPSPQPEVEDSHLSEVIPPEEPLIPADYKSFDEIRSLIDTFDDIKYQQTVQKYYLEENVYLDKPDQPPKTNDNTEIVPVSHYEDFNFENEFYKYVYSFYERFLEKDLIEIFFQTDRSLKRKLNEDTKLKDRQALVIQFTQCFIQKTNKNLSEQPLINDELTAEISAQQGIKIFEKNLFRGIILSTLLSCILFKSILGYLVPVVITYISLSRFKPKLYNMPKPVFWYMLLSTEMLTVTNILVFIIAITSCSFLSYAEIINTIYFMSFLYPLEVIIFAYIGHRMVLNSYYMDQYYKLNKKS